MPGMFQVGISAVIEDAEGRILLMRRASSKDFGALEWEPVSGRMEAGESPLDAVQREVLEETGLSVTSIAPFDTFHFDRNGIELVGIAFACHLVDGDLRLSPEHDQAMWVSREQVTRVSVSSRVGASLDRYWNWRGAVARVPLE